MILNRILFNLVLCLTLTVLIEAVFALILGVRTAYGQLTVFLSNVITNPILNCILTVVSFYISKSLYYPFLIPLELIVVIVEGLIYRKMLSIKINPFLLSLILNFCSYFIGTGIIKILF